MVTSCGGWTSTHPRGGDGEFQAIYRPDDPPASEFADKVAERRWLDRGRELARRIGPEVVFSVWGVRETIRRQRRIGLFLNDSELWACIGSGTATVGWRWRNVSMMRAG